MALDFVALDFETANTFRGSPCAVGLVKVRRGVVTEKQSLLMRPPAGHDHFDPWNVTIHGITAKKVMNEPRFVELWPQILDFIEDLPVVSHNAAFDLGVIREACIESALPWPNLRYACTLVLGRMTYQLLSYRLPFVAEAAGLPSFDHHDAGQDCLTSAHILIDIARRHNIDSLDGLLADLGVLWGHLDPEMWSGCRRHSGSSCKQLPSANPDADLNHPLYGQVVVFTGALQTMVRALAWDRVAFVGGQPAGSPTKRTTIVVEGMQDPTRLRPGVALSRKAEKARQLQQKGYRIELMGEPEFLALLADERGGGFRADIVDSSRYQSWLAEHSYWTE